MSYLDNIPSALRMHPKWMVCSADGSKWEKTPIDPVEGYAVEGRGKNNPEVWLSYDDARECTRVGTRMMGFICTLNDEYTIIDLDDVKNLKGKHSAESLERQDAILTWAYENDCYGEWSKSGNGCHIVVKGKLRGNVVKQGQAGFEAYGHNCEYVIITGRKIEGFGDEPIELPAEWIDYFNDFVSDSNSEWNQYGDGIDVDFLAKMDAPYDYDEQKLYSEKWAKVESWRTDGKYQKLRLGLDIGQPGEDASANDFDCLQACYSVLRGHAERDLAACRMFMALERADRIKAGLKSKRYLLEFSLPGVKARVDWKEKQEAQASESAYAGFGQAAAKMLAQANGSPMLSESTAIASASNMKLAPQPKLGANYRLSQKPDPTQAPLLRFLTPDEVEALPKLEWVLKGIFHKKSVNAIYGWSAVGKSFLALDLVAAIAEGREWFGRYTRKCNVDYLALEGSEGIRQRIKAYRIGNHKPYPQNVEFYSDRFNLLDENQVAVYIAQRERVKGGVVVIDTFSKGTAGINENDAGEMAKAVEHLERIKNSLEACVIVVHHSTKANAEGKAGVMRGSGALQAGLDGVIQVSYEDNIRKWTSDKVKEGKAKEEQEFELPAIKIETEIDPISGEVIDVESCYVKVPFEGVNSRVPPIAGSANAPSYDYSEPQSAKRNGKPLTKRQADEQKAEARNAKYNFQKGIQDALILGELELGAGGKGQFGAPPDRAAIPRNRLVELIVKVLNPHDPDDRNFLDKITDALDYAFNKGKIVRAVENKKQYFWRPKLE